MSTSCPYEPRAFHATPTGMHHCPLCGAMVVSGLPHLDDDAVREQGLIPFVEIEQDWGPGLQYHVNIRRAYTDRDALKVALGVAIDDFVEAGEETDPKTLRRIIDGAIHNINLALEAAE